MSNRKTHWERVYAEKTPVEVSWYQTEPTLSLVLIRDTGIGRRTSDSRTSILSGKRPRSIWTSGWTRRCGRPSRQAIQ
jgi:hypothetical protein